MSAIVSSISFPHRGAVNIFEHILRRSNSFCVAGIAGSGGVGWGCTMAYHGHVLEIHQLVSSSSLNFYISSPRMSKAFCLSTGITVGWFEELHKSALFATLFCYHRTSAWRRCSFPKCFFCAMAIVLTTSSDKTPDIARGMLRWN